MAPLAEKSQYVYHIEIHPAQTFAKLAQLDLASVEFVVHYKDGPQWRATKLLWHSNTMMTREIIPQKV